MRNWRLLVWVEWQILGRGYRRWQDRALRSSKVDGYRLLRWVRIGLVGLRRGVDHLLRAGLHGSPWNS